MRYINYLLILLIPGLMSSTCKRDDAPSTLIIYGTVPLKSLTGYDYLITESALFDNAAVDFLNRNNQSVFGYISLGEVSDYRPYYSKVKEYTIGKNKIWDSYYLDLTKPIVQESLIGFLDKQYKKGFRHFFFDTIDTYGKWGPLPDQGKNLVELLARIRERFPDALLIQNAGLDLVPQTHEYVDVIAIESVITDYDYGKEQYLMREKEERERILTELRAINKDYGLTILLIEYSDDKEDVARIKKKAEKIGFPFFIGNMDLQKHPKFN